MLQKFSVHDQQYQECAFDYGNIYQVIATTDSQRLEIGTGTGQVDLLMQLAGQIDPPFYILYVLVLSRLNQEPGRYQSPPLETTSELAAFLDEYRSYLETDGRHHIWIGAIDGTGLLVYDQHNVIYAYGPIARYESVLQKAGYKEQSFSFPVPHIHSFHEANDPYEDKILRHWDWQYFPLAEHDLYD